jgi:hypothetical protein
MNSVNELLKLFMRQAERENAMRQPDGARVADEQEPHAARRNSTGSPTSRVTPGVLRRHAD